MIFIFFFFAAIKSEINNIENGTFDIIQNPLKNAPHTQLQVIVKDWDLPYSREVAAFPAVSMTILRNPSLKIQTNEKLTYFLF